LARRNKRCPNPARIVIAASCRHFCETCRCRAQGCGEPRRGGLYCRKHKDQEPAPAENAFLGWCAC
jgi:hypothetical protein